jgi:acyl-CoA thioester hydrolase
MPVFIETYRGAARREDCDDLGHMNVQHYFAAVSNGMFAMMSRLGLTPEEIQRRQMSFAVVHAETDFHRELRSGDMMLLESTVLKLGNKSATFQHRLRNLSTDSVATTTDFKCVLLDLGRREAIPIPDDIRAAAAELAAA